MTKYRHKLPEGWKLNETYAFKCEGCGMKATFRPSMAMAKGDNICVGICDGCHAMLELYIDDKNESGHSRIF